MWNASAWRARASAITPTTYSTIIKRPVDNEGPYPRRGDRKGYVKVIIPINLH